jgi:hypothetical protein
MRLGSLLTGRLWVLPGRKPPFEPVSQPFGFEPETQQMERAGQKREGKENGRSINDRETLQLKRILSNDRHLSNIEKLDVQ